MQPSCIKFHNLQTKNGSPRVLHRVPSSKKIKEPRISRTRNCVGNIFRARRAWIGPFFSGMFCPVTVNTFTCFTCKYRQGALHHSLNDSQRWVSLLKYIHMYSVRAIISVYFLEVCQIPIRQLDRFCLFLPVSQILQ